LQESFCELVANKLQSIGGFGWVMTDKPAKSPKSSRIGASTLRWHFRRMAN
jgi:hypothetical protein